MGGTKIIDSTEAPMADVASVSASLSVDVLVGFHVHLDLRCLQCFHHGAHRHLDSPSSTTSTSVSTSRQESSYT